MAVRKKDDFQEFVITADEPIYTTGVISRLLDIPVHVLKQLDAEGVVKPPRKNGKARLYSKRELKKIEQCWFYIKEKNVKITGLKCVLEMQAKIDDR